jgi:hypothetical protein
VLHPITVTVQCSALSTTLLLSTVQVLLLLLPTCKTVGQYCQMLTERPTVSHRQRTTPSRTTTGSVGDHLTLSHSPGCCPVFDHLTLTNASSPRSSSTRATTQLITQTSVIPFSLAALPLRCSRTRMGSMVDTDAVSLSSCDYSIPSVHRLNSAAFPSRSSK